MALLQGLQIVIRNHQEQKLDAVRNPVINTPKLLFTDKNMLLMFKKFWHYILTKVF